MATASVQNTPKLQRNSALDRYFFTVVATAMIAISLVGFLPSIVNPAGRRAPLSLLAAAHGIVFFAWLILFLVQSRLVATARIFTHRRAGIAGVFLLLLMIPLGYCSTISMVRRGFDLSGDLKISPQPHDEYVDPQFGAIFPLTDLLMFAILAGTAIGYRCKPEIHKRLMLFANITLMGAPLAHFIGHTPMLANLMQPAIIMIPISMFLLAAVARDYLLMRRVRPLTWGLALLLFASGPIRANLIGPGAAWHHIVIWLAR
jgi:hypothetical protein